MAMKLKRKEPVNLSCHDDIGIFMIQTHCPEERESVSETCTKDMPRILINNMLEQMIGVLKLNQGIIQATKDFYTDAATLSLIEDDLHELRTCYSFIDLGTCEVISRLTDNLFDNLIQNQKRCEKPRPNEEYALPLEELCGLIENYILDFLPMVLKKDINILVIRRVNVTPGGIKNILTDTIKDVREKFEEKVVNYFKNLKKLFDEYKIWQMVRKLPQEKLTQVKNSLEDAIEKMNNKRQIVKELKTKDSEFTTTKLQMIPTTESLDSTITNLSDFESTKVIKITKVFVNKAPMEETILSTEPGKLMPSTIHSDLLDLYPKTTNRYNIIETPQLTDNGININYQIMFGIACIFIFGGIYFGWKFLKKCFKKRRRRNITILNNGCGYELNSLK